MAVKKKSPKKQEIVDIPNPLLSKVAKKKKAAKKKAAKKSRKKIDKNQKPAKKRVRKKQDTGKRANNGGKRKGSGRKKGATTKKTREIADKLVADGELTPLEYMLGVLRETPDDLRKEYEAGDIDVVEYTLKLKFMITRKDQAAEKAAPYIHPRLSSVEAKITTPEHERWLAMVDAAGK